MGLIVLWVEPMDTPHARLKAARIVAGFESAENAAQHFGFMVQTYSSHENGNRGLKEDVAKEYAKAFGTTPEWLLHGNVDGVPPPIRVERYEIDPLLVETWKRLTPKQRKKLVQFALTLSEE